MWKYAGSALGISRTSVIFLHRTHPAGNYIFRVLAVYGSDYETFGEFLAGIDCTHESDEAFADATAYAFSVLGRNVTSGDFEFAVSSIKKECQTISNLITVKRKLVLERI